MRNGTTAIQALPSNVSISSSVGIKVRKSEAATGQCANKRSCQLCAMTQEPPGGGHGRCPTEALVWRGIFIKDGTQGLVNRCF